MADEALTEQVINNEAAMQLSNVRRLRRLMRMVIQTRHCRNRVHEVACCLYVNCLAFRDYAAAKEPEAKGTFSGVPVPRKSFYPLMPVRRESSDKIV
jgi:hypothetical protein